MMLPDEGERRPLAQSALLFASMVGILVFANWGRPAEPQGLWHAIFAAKWLLTGGFVAVFLLLLAVWYGVAWWKAAAIAAVVVLAQLLLPGHPLLVFGIGVVALSLVLGTAGGEAGTWFAASWDFAKQILPLLLLGVLIAGALLGRVGEEGLVPAAWISAAVGGNSLAANFFAAFAGAFMYFATLTEVPIVQGLIGSGMGKGPALALLLAGPALSLPSMIVTHSVLGTRKTATFVVLVIAMATLSGMLYGHVFG
jgi:uncharacterized membrane protein YraQ (UPF0718 family)